METACTTIRHQERRQAELLAWRAKLHTLEARKLEAGIDAFQLYSLLLQERIIRERIDQLTAELEKTNA